MLRLMAASSAISALQLRHRRGAKLHRVGWLLRRGRASRRLALHRLRGLDWILACNC